MMTRICSSMRWLTILNSTEATSGLQSALVCLLAAVPVRAPGRLHAYANVTARVAGVSARDMLKCAWATGP